MPAIDLEECNEKTRARMALWRDLARNDPKAIRDYPGWDDKTKDFILGHYAIPNGAPSSKHKIFTEKDLEDMPELDLTVESNLVLLQVKELERTTTDSAVLLAIQKAKAGLIISLSSAKDKAFSAKECEEFEEVVLRVLDSILTVDQRDEYCKLIHNKRHAL